MLSTRCAGSKARIVAPIIMVMTHPRSRPHLPDLVACEHQERSGYSVVVWHDGAPSKPALGAPCNGCGLCCLAVPCPLGMWISRRRTGACAALLWCEGELRYQCGLLVEPARFTGWRRPWLLRWLSKLARRWIAAGVGCDADLEWERLPPPH